MSSTIEAASPERATAAPGHGTGRPAPGNGALTFTPIPPNRLDSLIVPRGGWTAAPSAPDA
ncbi:hypothetical protein [Luedemannella helvata]|uniref:Uncharacterized protein n=1 Tax=Luedemannella helvata TaxID=349315 RepID=A0ABP4XED9_9ACTN